MKKYLTIVNTLLLLALLGTCVYAFFTYIMYTDPVTVRTGDIRCTAELALGVDSDYDGILDEGNVYNTIDSRTGLVFSMIIPGRMLSYRVIIKNTGDAIASPELGFKLNSELLLKDAQGIYFNNALVYLFAIENVRYRIFENFGDSTTFVGDPEGTLNNYVLESVVENTPMLHLKDVQLAPNKSIEIQFKFKCLELTTIENYIHNSETLFLPPDFMQRLNFQIYFDNIRHFKLDYVSVGLRSVPIRK